MLKLGATISRKSHEILRFPSTSHRWSSAVSGSLSADAGSGDVFSPGRAKKASEIPGPKRWPLIGSFYSIAKQNDHPPDKIHYFWDDCFEKYGPIFRLDTPGQKPTVFIYLPEHVDKLLKHTPESERSVFKIISLVRNADKTDSFAKNEAGLLFEGGEQGGRLRKLTQGPTMKMKILNQYLDRMDSISLEFLEKIYKLRDDKNDLPEDTLDHIFNWAMESLCLVTFSRRIGCLDGSKESVQIIQDIHNFLISIREVSFEFGLLWQWFRTPAYKKFETAHNKILGYVKEVVERSKVTLQSKLEDDKELDLIETFLTTPGMKMSDLYVYLMDFLAAGIDNTSATIAFTMLNLARHPEKQAKVHEELDRVLGKDVDQLKPQHLGQLSYLKGAVKETLRLNPVSFGVIREPERDIEIGGYTIPPGFAVFVLTKQSSMMEEHFPRATEFLPERWLRDRPLGSINPYASLPFGVGPRSCIGRRLAEQEMYTLLARMFHKYKIEWRHGDVGTRMNLLLLPDKPLRFTMTKRQ
ncbi:probable cytochrome P450 49a1 [Palaemon carinicauda]|uniref:probable cytochrome P450 49a1 n=1 Tax=Palaemon carinicauda TaxID=392227 RepID=UPI0035B64B9C